MVTGLPLNPMCIKKFNISMHSWDGSRMTYGDGSATDNFKPLTAIDVCGHEITHGLTSLLLTWSIATKVVR